MHRAFRRFSAKIKIVRFRWVRLEINPDHGAQFQIDEQQQDVIDLDVSVLQHPQKFHHRRPGGHRTNGEQRQVVERLHKQIAQRFSQPMDLLAQLFGPVDFHEGTSLGRFDRIMRVGRDGCSACRKKARGRDKMMAG
jgi:hypothetical protein